MTTESGNDNNSCGSAGTLLARKTRLSAEVARLLETDFGMDADRARGLVESYFGDGFLPPYYFFSNNSSEIAGHVFIIMQMLGANTEYLRHESDDGRALTYIVNVGRDLPGELAGIVEENLAMDIVSFDSVKAASGIRIVTLEKSGRAPIMEDPGCGEMITAIKRDLLRGDVGFAKEFIAALPPNYLEEEVRIVRPKPRVMRHLDLFARAMEERGTVVSIEPADAPRDAPGAARETRLSIAVKNPDARFVLNALRIIERRGINLHRSYLDTFEPAGSAYRVAILSLYMDEACDAAALLPELEGIAIERPGADALARENLGKELDGLVRTLSDDRSGPGGIASAIARLRELARVNGDMSIEGEPGNFLLNAITDFFNAASFLGIDGDAGILRSLLRFESLGEFFVTTRNGGTTENLPGYRFAHNTSRGPGKGGLRLAPIVRFDEVCALAFMMTWKTARSGILFGGAKGGLLVDPAGYAGRRHDFNETLENFGRSLFLYTGPLRDVPAGDVGCGSGEIGILFEGFKSALRDLALVASGIKRGVTLIGNRAVSAGGAGETLAAAFGMERGDRRALAELVSSERYLELAAAPQITGKPRMGIDARRGATGRGLLYGILAMTGRLYLDGKWVPAAALTPDDEALLKKAAAFTGEEVLAGRDTLASDGDWALLVDGVYPKLLGGKRIVVQGTGRVGGSVIRELARFGVNLVAVADAGGAVIGDHLDAEEVLAEADRSPGKSCVGAKVNVSKTIRGAAEGAAALLLDCDILLPCALENVITAEVARRLEARLVVSGGNGAVTSKGYAALHGRGIPVLCDFIVNSGGVIASYFEWLRNLSDRARYEAETLRGGSYDADVLDRHIMPEFGARIKGILAAEESPDATRRWNMVMRDIIFSAVNGDYDSARRHGVPPVTAGLAGAILRVLASMMAAMPEEDLSAAWRALPDGTKALLRPHFDHPEIRRTRPSFGARRGIIGP